MDWTLNEIGWLINDSSATKIADFLNGQAEVQLPGPIDRAAWGGADEFCAERQTGWCLAHSGELRGSQLRVRPDFHQTI